MNKNNNIQVSICCAVYNHKPYLQECLDSFLMQQTNFRFEILIHDDASTDGSTGIIHEYENKYPHIIKGIYQDTNQYSVTTRAIITRFLLPEARGKYIALCEGDDYWIDPYKLQLQFEFMDAHPGYSLCFHDAFIEIERKIKRRYKPYSQSKEVPYNDIIMAKKYFCPTSAIFFRKAILKDYPEVYLKCHVGDYALRLYLGMKGKVYYIHKSMSVYRNGHQGSWSRQQKSNTKEKSRIFWQTELDVMLHVDKVTDFYYHPQIIIRKLYRDINQSIRERNVKELTYDFFRNDLIQIPWKSRIKLILKIYTAPCKIKSFFHFS